MTAAQRNTADRMIEAKGQSVTLTRQSAGSYSTSTGAVTITSTTQTGKGVILPLAGLRKWGNTNVVLGDKQCLLSGLNSAGAALTAPKVGDTLTDANSTVYEITDIAPLEPAGLAIIYDLTVRAAA